jgi:uncharacterized membrane protein YdjX (TVP38/TMEM64 family)
MKPEQRQALLQLGFSLLFIIILSILAYIFRDQLRALSRYGYLAAFLTPLLANATVIVPIPGVWVIAMLGTLYNPMIVAILGGLGAAAGELTGYLVGYEGKGLVEQSPRYMKIHQWMGQHERLADLVIMVMAVIPNPFFDLAGMAAGSLKIPVWRFYVFCALGSIIKMMAFAFGGNTIRNFLQR